MSEIDPVLSRHDPSLKQHRKKKHHRDRDHPQDGGDDAAGPKTKKRKHSLEHQLNASPSVVDPDIPGASAATDKKRRKEKRKHATEDPQVDVSGGEAYLDKQIDAGRDVSSTKERRKKKRNRQMDVEVETSADNTSADPADPPVKNKETKEKAPSPSHMEPVTTTLSSSVMPQPIRANGNLFPLPNYGSYSQPNVSLFPTFSNLPLSHLSFGSNEDVLRALQDIDITKIAGVLPGAAGAAHLPLTGAPSTSTHLAPSDPSSVSGRASSMPRPERKNKKSQSKHAHGLALPASSSEPVFHSDHERLLATKWMGPTKLAELVKSEGLVYTKGKFTASEIKQINGALENYRTSRGLTEEEVNNIMFARDGKHKDNSFWSEITSALTRRPICAVYHYLRRAHHPMKQQGKWRPEEDAQLMQAVVSLGQQWEKIAPLVGRMAPDCRDRYRNHIVDQEKRNTGTWSAAEEEELTRIVVDMQKGKDLDHDVFWGRVSELMGGKRSRQQCRMKWTDSLSSKHRSHGQQMLRWSARDASIFIHRIDSLNVQDEADIPWKSLRDPQWDLWSPHVLQRRWSNMKKKIKGFENMSHPEIMDILRLKIVQSTQSVTNGDAEPRAGSSTGQGTLTRQVIDEDDSEDSE